MSEICKICHEDQMLHVGPNQKCRLYSVEKKFGYYFKPITPSLPVEEPTASDDPLSRERRVTLRMESEAMMHKFVARKDFPLFCQECGREWNNWGFHVKPALPSSGEGVDQPLTYADGYAQGWKDSESRISELEKFLEDANEAITALHNI